MSTVGTLKKLLDKFPDDLALSVWVNGEYVRFDPKRSHWFHDADYASEPEILHLMLGSNVDYELDPVYHLDLS